MSGNVFQRDRNCLLDEFLETLMATNMYAAFGGEGEILAYMSYRYIALKSGRFRALL